MLDFSKDIALVGHITAAPTILDVICRTTGMGFAAIARVTEEKWVACSVLDQIQFGLLPGGELPIETTFCRDVRQSREPVIIDHVDDDEIYRSSAIPRHYGFQSYISMPIFLADKSFYGTLCAIDPKPSKVKTPAVIGMFQMFAELIAFHIDAAAKLAASESSLLAERETSVLREQFIAVLGHDLQGPLGAITMGTALLKEGGLGETQTGLVDMMEASATRMSGLIGDVMDFARGRLGAGMVLNRETDLRLGILLEQIINEARANYADRRIEAHIEITGPVSYDHSRMAQLFANLLANAMTHGKIGHPVVVSATDRGGKFILSISNAADRLPASVLERLFEPFSRGNHGDHQQGLGLGLYIASQIAGAHGGVLEVVSTADEVQFSFIME